jgi:hypothetical protein
MKTLTKIGMLLVVMTLASFLLSSCSSGYAAEYHSHKFSGTAKAF